jgi:hypothetical protein
MGNTTDTAGNTFWTALSNKVVQWTRKKTQKSPLLPRQTPVASPKVQPQQRPTHTQSGDVLMICMQSGKRSKNIYQEDLYVRDINDDQALILFLRQMSVSHRGTLRSYLSLRTVKELKFVEVSFSIENPQLTTSDMHADIVTNIVQTPKEQTSIHPLSVLSEQRLQMSST